MIVSSPSQQELVVALSHLVVQYESNFCTVALQFIEEEKNYPLPSPAAAGIAHREPRTCFLAFTKSVSGLSMAFWYCLGGPWYSCCLRPLEEYRCGERAVLTLLLFSFLPFLEFKFGDILEDGNLCHGACRKEH